MSLIDSYLSSPSFALPFYSSTFLVFFDIIIQNVALLPFTIVTIVCHVQRAWIIIVVPRRPTGIKCQFELSQSDKMPQYLLYLVYEKLKCFALC